MIKKFYVYLIVIIFFVGCSPEFKPSGDIPDLESTIDEIFVDTIDNMVANIKLDFVNDSCRSISALYGDEDNIYYQIIWVDE